MTTTCKTFSDLFIEMTKSILEGTCYFGQELKLKGKTNNYFVVPAFIVQAWFKSKIVTPETDKSLIYMGHRFTFTQEHACGWSVDVEKVA